MLFTNMGYIEFRTWKTLDRDGITHRWNNRWLLSCPYDSSHPECLDVASRINRLERQPHFDSTMYESVTVTDYKNPSDATGYKGQVWTPGGEYIRGQQPTPINPAPFNYALCVRKEVDTGYLGKWFFFNCLKDTDYTQASDKRYYLHQVRSFDYLFDTWIASLYNDFAAQLVVPQGLNRYHTAISYSNAVSLQPLCVSLLTKSPRKLAKYPPKGEPAYEALRQQSYMYALWLSQIREWLAFNHDFVPEQARDNTIDILGQVKAAITQAANDADPQDQNGQSTGQQMQFRWTPDADAIRTISDTMKAAFPEDVKQITQEQSYLDVSGDMALTHDQTDRIYQRILKYQGWLAELVRADWLNPINQTAANAA